MAIGNKIPQVSQPISGSNGMASRPWYNYLNNVNTMTISTGINVPDFIPNAIGDEYLDLTAKRLYKAFGTISSSDWILIN